MSKRIAMHKGRARLVHGDNGPLGVFVRDDAAPTDRAHIRKGVATSAGLPITVTLPFWATHAQIYVGGLKLLVPPGPSVLTRTDLGMRDDADSIRVLVRPWSSTSDNGRWDRDRFFFDRQKTSSPAPLAFLGVPEMTTTGVEGAAISYAWAPFNQAPAAEQRLLRVYAAAGDTTPTATHDPAPATMPAVYPGWVAAVQRAQDALTNQWIEVESARVQIIDAIDPAVLASGDVTWSPVWTDPAKRQTYRATASLAGTGAADQVRWRIDTERFQSGWINCSWNGTNWTLGSLIQMLEEVGRGTDLAEFRPHAEASYAVRLQKKVGAGAWSTESVKLHVPAPAGATVPNATASTRAELLTAINGYASVGLAPYVIHLTADFAVSSTISVSGIKKQGHPIIITSADRANPRRLSGYGSRALDLTNCENIVFDRIRFWNNVTITMGGQDLNGTVYPPMVVNGGQVMRTTTCARFHCLNCLVRDHNNAFENNNARSFWFGFNEFSGLSQDGIRFWKSSNRCLVQGNYAHDPLIYDAWANANVSSSQYMHPDFTQLAVDTGQGPHTGFQFIGNRIKGFNGYFTGVFLKSAAVNANPSLMESAGVLAPEVRDNYFELGHGIAIMLVGGRDLISRNNVFRKFPGSTKKPTVHLWGYVSGTQIVQDCVGEQPIYSSDETTPMTKAQRLATVSGAVTVSTNGWPSTWPAGGGETAYPTGPDSYMALAA